MAPSPQETMVEQGTAKESIIRPWTGDEVVISGMSGIFPSSDSVLQFKENIYNKVDMVTSDNPRWIFNHPEVPKHMGKVNGMGKFDAQFFRVHYKQACTMEPMSRKLLEHAYSAIYDSGINPLQLRGRKVGVFVGSTFSESERVIIYENIQRNGFGITGCNKAMYANRISYWIDAKGPSYALDIACASSMACLEHAYRSISTGQCEAAIVGGCNLCMQPTASLNLSRAGFLCLDGKTKSFDKNGDGYVRSDAINVLFLQKAKDAKRIYSEVYHAKGNYSTILNDQYLPIRETKIIEDFLESFYSEINISPNDVEYIEANGSGLAEADGNELEAIGNFFAKEAPVKVGSVKSNMGHSEPASGASALTKVCLAYQEGKLPANLHYNEPQDHITSVRDGRVQVLTENTPFNRGFSALNSFSYSGANVHVLLKGHYKPKELERYKSSLPYLVLASGRQENCVNKILETLKSQQIDPEQIGLLHGIHENDIPGHMCRGYTILECNKQKETVCITQNAEFCPGTSRPLWFVYSGMGSQWAGMGADLMRIPIFAAAVEKCHRVLEPKGIDIVKILTDPDKSIYDNIIHSFVGIAAVQIGLTDILTDMGIVPDNIIGHSVGELACAYADGCFTAEEMILSAYSRGLVSVQTPFIRGAMAAVGLGYKSILALCPPEVEVACHNSSESSTISGPSDIIKQFVADLTSRGIFAKEVPCSNIAFHSRYIADAGPGLLKYLSDVIKAPKPRSAKWVSTSVPQDQWQEPEAKYSSAEYHTNNLLSSVLFEETSKLIPANALVIEVAPHGLLQAILKRSLSECINLPLTRRGHSDPVKFLLEAIGKSYQAGLNPKVSVIYPKIEYPVSTETPLLSHFVEWEHSEDWPQAKYNEKDRVMATARDFVMSIHDDDYKHFRGHVREGNYVFPEAALLVLVWETLAMHKGVKYEDMSVTFEDVQFYCEANLMAEIPLRFSIMIHKGNNQFEISYEYTRIVSGFIKESKSVNAVQRTLEELDVGTNDVVLSAKDIYKIMHLRGYSYEDVFQSIQVSNTKRNSANIKWDNDWVTFIDSLIQFNCFARDHDGVSTPKLIRKLNIDTQKHFSTKQIIIDDITCYNAKIHSLYGISRSAGVELEGIVFTDKPVVDQQPDVIQTREFISHFPSGNIELKAALHINLQIICDNAAGNEIKIIDQLLNPLSDIFKVIKEVTDEIPSGDFVLTDVQKPNMDYYKILNDKKWKLIIMDNLLADEQKMKYLHANICKNTFILAIEKDTTVIHPKYKLFNVISVLTVQKQIFILLNKTETTDDVNVTYMPIAQDNKLSWVPKVQAELQKSRRIVLVSQRQPYCILGVVKSLRKTYGNNIGLVIVDDFHVPTFNPENNIYKEQLQKNLAFNIFKKGQWGGYYNIPCAKIANFRNISLTSTIPGDLDSLSWVGAGSTPSSHNLVQVCYAGPSFKDVQSATNNITRTKTFGMDFSGVNKRGDKVMGLVPGGAISSTVEADPNLLWPVPEHWTLEDAATVPLPYVLAYYCLTERSALLQQGNENIPNVFVNGGAGALGQAIISICLANGFKVYTNVSDERKKSFLLKLFPSLNEENITNSAIDCFVNMVVKNTNNKLCDLVINCHSSSYRQAAMKCVGYTSDFLDLSDYDANENKEFGMSFLFNKRSYRTVQLSGLFRPENVDQKKRIQYLIAEGISNGSVKPLSRVVYSPLDVSRAFRCISSSKHRGKILLRMRERMTNAQGLSVTPRMSYSANGSYIVVCDEYELGIELVDRLVKRGSKKIVIHIKPKCIGGYYKTKLALWKKLSVTIELSSENLQTNEGCVNLLKQGAKLGPILGIFIVHNFKDNEMEKNFKAEDVVQKLNETAWVVANLDLKSRSMCNELNHFVVLNNSSKSLTDNYAVSVSEKICQSRNDIGLPGLAFHVPLLNEFNNKLEQVQSKTQPQSLSTVFNALETSVKLNYKNVVTFDTKKRKPTDFLKKIATVIGAKHIDAVNETMNLEDLTVNNTNLEEIKTIIKRSLKIDYPIEKIKEMSIVSLKNLCQYIMIKQNTKFNSGLGAFYTNIDKDECLATEPMVAMPTKLSNATENEEELDPKAVYLMLIPGFEGHSQLFVPVCERLKVLAMTFQLGPDLIDCSIQQMAVNIFKFMKKRFELKSKFYLLGYSFGVNVALELAALFEKEGLVGIVYCLDSSPDALRVQLDAYVGNLTDTQLQDTIIKHMYHLMTGRDSTELTQDLAKMEKWADKVEICVIRLRESVNYSNQYKRSILQTAYQRIQLAREYEPDFKLESQLVLMKGIPHPDAVILANDYNLSKYTKQPVQVFNIESDHALAPQDCRVSNIINKLLEPKLLKDFKNKNLCETYLADPHKIL